MTTTFTEGDTAPALVGDVSSGLVAATVALHPRKPDGTTVTKAAVVTNDTEGIWTYEWGPTDLDQPGKWYVEAEVTYDGGDVETFGPNSFIVRKAVGSP